MSDLVELALDLRWSWDHGADHIWRALDADLWDITRNPIDILQTISQSRLRGLIDDPEFRRSVETLAGLQRESDQAPAWFQQAYAQSPLTAVAYFSMEFMLGEALPIYSGGLGNVAGDQLKAASDLGVPLVGVGLLYQRGYFRQAIDANGQQLALYPYNDPGQLPISPARDASGEWVRIELDFPGGAVRLRAWQAQVGRLKLYLLDSNDPLNQPIQRSITSELYGGGSELRLVQEVVLGIGGYRLLQTLGFQPEVCHLNEGHAALAVLERAASYRQTSGQPFDVALAVTRAGNVFTTHTPVAAGFDRFSPALINLYLGQYAEKRLGLTLDELLALGRHNPDDPNEPFNMAYLAIRCSGAINGVSQLHGTISRRIFQPLFPRWPELEVPIGHVTNGVHVPTWDSQAADQVWTRACGPDRWLGINLGLADRIRQLTDSELWAMRTASRQALIADVRKRLARQWAAAGMAEAEVAQARQIFDPSHLTLGFARRFATYKRPALLLHDPDRLTRLLTRADRSVQLIVAGKAHPADLEGQRLVKQWVDFTRRAEVRSHIVFLADYDMLLTEQLAGGVDVWLNNPRRPWEACGTSGMKVLANGGLNLSVLDGWWAEAFRPDVGWSLGDGHEHGDDPAWDASEADALYTILENEVVPEFYTRDANGLSTRWLARVRESMATLTPRFSANRAVHEYIEAYYLPAAMAHRARAADNGALGAQIVSWRLALADSWPSMRFGELQVETREGQHGFNVQVDFGNVDRNAVRVELFADVPNDAPFRQPMSAQSQVLDSENAYLYTAQVPATRPASDFTPRITPYFQGVAVPLEISLILWQH
jgi:starch phosphorylase